MILTIEIGNSTITLGGVEGDEVRFQCRINTDRVKTSDTYCIDLKTLFEIYGIGLETIEASSSPPWSPRSSTPSGRPSASSWARSRWWWDRA